MSLRIPFFLNSEVPGSPQQPATLARPTTPPPPPYINLSNLDLDSEDTVSEEEDDRIIPSWLFSSRKPNTTRDDRRDILNLHLLGYQIRQIADTLDLSYQQVYYFLNTINKRLTPRKSTGRSPYLSRDQLESLQGFITRNGSNRRLTAREISNRLFQGTIGERAIFLGMQRLGYQRRVVIRKPPLSDANRSKRLAFARAHLYWTIEDWSRILWTDECYFSLGTGTYREWVWRRSNEAYYRDCVGLRLQKRKSIMVWASFHGSMKGPFFFWDRQQHGTVTSATYCRYCVPLAIERINSMRQQCNIHLTLQQDNASTHRAIRTQAMLQSYGVLPMEWPPYSPDLNPIETLWSIMKGFLARNHPIPSQDPTQIRRAIEAAWDSIEPVTLQRLIEGMPNRMREVIANNGGHTHY